MRGYIFTGVILFVVGILVGFLVTCFAFNDSSFGSNSLGWYSGDYRKDCLNYWHYISNHEGNGTTLFCFDNGRK